MRVLSLFDGMSCCQIALNRAGKKPTVYYASEVDKHAIKVTMANYTDTIQLGDVRNVNPSSLGHVDLLAGGSPCQSFSFAGKRKGMSTKDNVEILTIEHYLELKAQNFEFEGQSYLFWEYIRILTELRKINPDIKFLLENVIMGEKWQKVLTRAIGINPIRINASLVSAQNRDRLFWTNIGAEQDGLFGDLKCTIPQPKDKGILLKDILEAEVDEKYYVKNPKFGFEGMDIGSKGNTLRTGGHQSQSSKHNYDLIKVDKKGNIKENQDKASCFTAGGNSGGNHSDMDLIVCVASRGRDPENPSNREKGLNTEQRLEPRNDGKTNCLTSVQKDNLVLKITEATKKGYTEIRPGECFDFENPNSETRRGRKMDKKTNCLMAKETAFMQFTNEGKIRRLTPLECERLQCVPDGYTNHVSDTQRYRMLGNGWNCDVITHIFNYL